MLHTVHTALFAPLHQALTSHGFGRAPLPAADDVLVGQGTALDVSRRIPLPDPLVEDLCPDLAQRVREVGEW